MKAFIFALFFAPLAHAHIEPGIYAGTTEDGSMRQLKATQQYYEGGIPHPPPRKIAIETQSVVPTSKGAPMSARQWSAMILRTHAISA